MSVQSPSTGHSASPSGETASDLSAKLEQRPELAVGGAFAGGMILALILKRLVS